LWGNAASSSNSAAYLSSGPTSSRYSTKFSVMAAAVVVSPTNQRSAITQTASEMVSHPLVFQFQGFRVFGFQLSCLLLSTALFPESSLYFRHPVSCFRQLYFRSPVFTSAIQSPAFDSLFSESSLYIRYPVSCFRQLYLRIPVFTSDFQSPAIFLLPLCNFLKLF
jgi:hypothetical protein